MCVCTQFQAFCNKLKSTELNTPDLGTENKLELNLVFISFSKKKKVFCIFVRKG